jgi:cytoskeletal protein CcmA (bactofilin family)
MFGRKKQSDDDKILPELADELGIPAKPGSRPAGATPTTSTPASPPSRPPVMPPTPRPFAEGAKPGEPAKAAGEMTRPAGAPLVPTPVKREVETRKLIVGREISLSGEITACDRLVVEGSVQANLANCRDIDIADSGLFKGSASIDDAEIRGRFEGTLTVRRRLLIRASGRVVGTVRYGQIEIECGGQISGDVQSQPMPEAQTETASSAATAPRPSMVSMPEEAKAV